jgi:hypothetical protein
VLQLVSTTHGMCCKLVIIATHVLCVVSIVLQKACLLVVNDLTTDRRARVRVEDLLLGWGRSRTGPMVSRVRLLYVRS